jgi:hypothetical protein
MSDTTGQQWAVALPEAFTEFVRGTQAWSDFFDPDRHTEDDEAALFTTIQDGRERRYGSATVTTVTVNRLALDYLLDLADNFANACGPGSDHTQAEARASRKLQERLAPIRKALAALNV